MLATPKIPALQRIGNAGHKNSDHSAACVKLKNANIAKLAIEK